jgi:hypothetical protein
MTRVIRLHLSRAQARMKRQADKHRSERSFAVGDSVYLKLQPYVQSSIATRSNNKLSFRFFGPFTILERIGEVAYRLQLPASSTIHPVFHVSQLKRAVGRNQVLVPHLPQGAVALQVHMRILQRRMITRGGRSVRQVKVLWSDTDLELATWEDEEALQVKFPAASAWGQASTQAGGNVEARTPTNVEEQVTSVKGSSARARRPNSKFIGPQWAV